MHTAEAIRLARPTHISAPPVLFNLLQAEWAGRLREALRGDGGDGGDAGADAGATTVGEAAAAEDGTRTRVAADVRSLLGNRLVRC